jgi:hypothetical protein
MSSARWHDLRRLALFAACFAGGIVAGGQSVHPLWQTVAVMTAGFLICAAGIDYVFDPIRAFLRRPRPDRDRQPAPDIGRQLDDDRAGWIKDGR